MREYSAAEFVPLPYFGWDSRPETLDLDVEECATAIYLAKGDIRAAAARLKVTSARLNKLLRRAPKLQRLCSDLAAC